MGAEGGGMGGAADEEIEQWMVKTSLARVTALSADHEERPVSEVVQRPDAGYDATD